MADINRQMLDELERISRLMLEQAKSAEWEQVVALEQERRQWLSDGFPLAGPTDADLQLEGLLKTLIELDKQVMGLARARRAELGDLLGRLNQGRKADRAYRDHTLSE